MVTKICRVKKQKEQHSRQREQYNKGMNVENTIRQPKVLRRKDAWIRNGGNYISKGSLLAGLQKAMTRCLVFIQRPQRT